MLLTIYLIFPSAWIMRNYLVHQKPMISSVLEVNMLYHFTPEIIENGSKEEKLFLETKARLTQYVPVKEFSESARLIFWEAVKANPLKSIIKATKTAILVTVKPLRSYFDLQLFPTKTNETSWFTWCLVIVQIIVQVFCLLLLLYSIIKLPHLRWLLIPIIYFVLASSVSVPDARFRIPFSAFIYILAAAGIDQLITNERPNKVKS